MSTILLSPLDTHIAKGSLHEKYEAPDGEGKAKGGDDGLIFVGYGGIVLGGGEVRGEGAVAGGFESVEEVGGGVD